MTESVIYVIDTGINVNDPSFGGRAEWGTSVIGGPNRDQNGHGTFCAGLAASNQTRFFKLNVLFG